jgi:NAD(P)-dependent dehydrogenase (short-subunit alcohol dehydrogenase family)
MAGLVAISGGASGIGAAIATAVRGAGGAAAVADLNATGTDQRLDVTDAAAVEAWISGLGPLTGAVTSAGISGRTPTLETDPALFRRIMDVNVTGSFLVAQAAARRMAPGGSIVLIASVFGLSGPADRVAYAASKAAVVNMAAAMAVDLAPRGIRVNALCPGPVETPLAQQLHDAATRAAWVARIPQRRYAQPEDIAQVALFLLNSAQSGHVTGQAIAVDGGYSTAGLMP